MPTRSENFLVSKVGLMFQVFGAWREQRGFVAAIGVAGDRIGKAVELGLGVAVVGRKPKKRIGPGKKERCCW